MSRGDIYLSLLCDTHEIRVGPAEVLRYRLMHYIDTRMYSMKHLEDLSEITGYSYGYLSAKFKRTTERTLSEYHQEKRLDAAALLVSDPCLTVTEVADMLNYTSVYSSAKRFASDTAPRPVRGAKPIIKFELTHLQNVQKTLQYH